MRVTDPAAIGPALDAALEAGETTLIDVMTDPDAAPPITYFEAG